MKKIIMVFLAVILFCTGIKSQSVGLVMSGGGARGIDTSVSYRHWKKIMSLSTMWQERLWALL